METFTHTVTDAAGMHARPAGVLAREAKAFASTIEIEKGGKRADVRRILSVMGLGIQCGDTITVTITGTDEQQAAQAMQTFFQEHI